MAYLVEAVLKYVTGDLNAAHDFLGHCLAADEHDPRGIGLATHLAYEIGEFMAGNLLLSKLYEPGLTSSHVLGSAIIPLANWISGERKWIEKAADAVISTLGVTTLTSAFAHVALGISAVLKGDSIGAKNFSEAFEIAIGTMSIFCHVSIDRILGILRGFLIDFAIAHAHFENALIFCRKAVYRPELAWLSTTTSTPCCGVMTPGIARRPPLWRTSLWPSQATSACGL